MIQQLVTTSSITMLERTLNFTEQRHGLLLENIANVSTPGYIQQDADPRAFQSSLAQAIAQRRPGYADDPTPASTSTVSFSKSGSNLALHPRPVSAMPFHDQGVRSMEYLMSQLADNAQAHNVAANLLKGKYDTMQKAITMKV